MTVISPANKGTDETRISFNPTISTSFIFMAYCDRCDRSFSFYDALYQHLRDSSRHNQCGDCGEDYWTYQELREHWIGSPDHHYCDFCDEEFYYEDELDDHNEQNHEFCDFCDLWLETNSEIQSHRVVVHNCCLQCDRYFSSPNGLKNHLNSSVHRPKTLTCFGRGCNKRFSSTANLLLHLDTNSCVSGITRQTINRAVTRLDRNNLITNPNRMITASTESYQATRRAWNGYNFECYLCHKEFNTLLALNQHLASPIHERAIYRCPKLGTGCNLEFKTLGALFQHVENGSCGVRKFKVVQEGIDTLMQGMKRITLH
ncbi:hypothetical protein FRC08_005497 [Ceratobasidium sp. 394]|nr:hypothetical protein FRC08_005497 [Ceratobasidium sp. 394]